MLKCTWQMPIFQVKKKKERISVAWNTDQNQYNSGAFLLLSVIFMRSAFGAELNIDIRFAQCKC